MEDDYWVEDSSVIKTPVSNKRKRRVGKRKIEFIGWGSRPLIEFLEGIGKDTKENYSQREVATFITRYINEKRLASAEKKKKVICDERLFAIFGKKFISRLKVHDMLEEHFAENHDESDDYSSDEEGCEKKVSSGSKKNITGQIKKVTKIPKSCFAAVIVENIKLVYLKKSVIQELLKVPESFEFKIVGSFIRMKSDPDDIYQKNKFQLQQVTGVEKEVPGAGSEICLRVSNFFKEVPISLLSNDNFSKEEIEDVHDRIKAGLLKRLTVKEVEERAQILHADITKNWIAREISSLQARIDHANEKGWRREMFEYVDRKTMLETPSEQEKLLLKIPEVIAEELEPEVIAIASSEKSQGSDCSPKSILRVNSDVSSADASGCVDTVAPSQVIFSNSHAPEAPSGGIDGILSVDNPNGDQPANIQQVPLVAVADVICCDNEGSEEATWVVVSGEENKPVEKKAEQQANIQQVPLVADVICCDDEESGEATWVAFSGEENKPVKKEAEQPANIQQASLVADVISCDDEGSGEATRVAVSGEENKPVEKKAEQPVVIDLSDDDDDNDNDNGNEKDNDNDNDNVDEWNNAIWYYVDPRGRTQGPFTLNLLKQWFDANYFLPGFKVWNSDHISEDTGVLLIKVLSETLQKDD